MFVCVGELKMSNEEVTKKGTLNLIQRYF